MFRLWFGDRCVGSLSRKKAATIAVCIDPADRPISYVVRQVPVNKANQLELLIPAKGATDAPIALALGPLKQVV